jgi:hypothetical protein
MLNGHILVCVSLPNLLVEVYGLDKLGVHPSNKEEGLGHIEKPVETRRA